MLPSESAVLSTDWSLLLQKVQSDCCIDNIIDQVECQLDRFLDVAAHRDHDKTTRKKVIVDTRTALRCALCYLNQSDDLIRTERQHELYRIISKFLTLINDRNVLDRKCRLLCSKIVCNAITANTQNSESLLSLVGIQPSQEMLEKRLKLNLSDDDIIDTISDDSLNWVDLVLATKDDRECLGVCVATLYNCMMCQLGDNATVIQNCMTDMAGSGLFVSTLLRQLLSSEAITTENTTVQPVLDEDTSDAATEWITLLLSQLSRQGLFSTMYSSISASSESVLPEQVILLHSLRQQMSDLVNSDDDDVNLSLFLEQWSEEIVRRECLFLSVLTETTSQVCISNANNTCDSDSALSESALLCLLEIVSDILGANTVDVAAIVREAIGIKTSLIYQLSFHLGSIFDDIYPKLASTKVRDWSISNRDQRLLTLLVRLLGNLCYKCKRNQDLLRTTSVPSSTASNRTALHVLMSCTSLSMACATLREWAVVAIRYALDDNEANQQVVADLEAHKANESAELDHLGVHVALDNNGKVSVIPK